MNIEVGKKYRLNAFFVKPSSHRPVVIVTSIISENLRLEAQETIKGTSGQIWRPGESFFIDGGNRKNCFLEEIDDRPNLNDLCAKLRELHPDCEMIYLDCDDQLCHFTTHDYDGVFTSADFKEGSETHKIMSAIEDFFGED